MTLTPVPLDRLDPDPTQPRTVLAPAELDALADSIRTRGLLSPLRVRPADAGGRHVLVSGHRRYAALVKLGVATAPCVIIDGPADEAAGLAEQLAENVHRQSLSPVEEAAACLRYMALRDGPAAQAARELHVPPTRLAKLLPLLGLPAAVRAVKTKRPAAEAGLRRVVLPLAGGPSVTVTGPSVSLPVLIDVLEAALREARTARRQGLDVSTLARVLKDRAANGGAA